MYTLRIESCLPIKAASSSFNEIAERHFSEPKRGSTFPFPMPNSCHKRIRDFHFRKKKENIPKPNFMQQFVMMGATRSTLGSFSLAYASNKTQSSRRTMYGRNGRPLSAFTVSFRVVVVFFVFTGIAFQKCRPPAANVCASCK